MPSGVYVRTKPISEKQLAALSKGREIASKLPKTAKQKETSRKNFIKATKASASLPRTTKQVETAYINGCNHGYQKGQPHPHEGTVFANDVVKHHNDLQHGAERPDDITPMTLSEHMRLHNKLRVNNGTNPFLRENRAKT